MKNFTPNQLQGWVGVVGSCLGLAITACGNTSPPLSTDPISESVEVSVELSEALGSPEPSNPLHVKPPESVEAASSFRSSVAGIDRDQDGIRDDVQQFILQWVPQDPVKQAALQQTAWAYQGLLQTSQHPRRATEYARALLQYLNVVPSCFKKNHSKFKLI